MLNRTLLTLFLGALAPAYLQAGTGAAANANAAASAADVKSSAADVKSSAAAQQQVVPLQVPAGIISCDAINSSRQFNAGDSKRIMAWLKEDPQNRKHAIIPDHYFPSMPILNALIQIRFAESVGCYHLYYKSPAIQPALDFLLSLKPSTCSEVGRRPGDTGGNQNFMLIANASSACNDAKDQSDFCNLAKQITRLMFLNGRNLLQIKYDADHLQAKRKTKLEKLLMDRATYVNLKQVPYYEGELDRHRNHITAFQEALAEVETIRQEAGVKLALLTSQDITNALRFPDELKRIVEAYSTELSPDEALRALAELSAPQPQVPAE